MSSTRWMPVLSTLALLGLACPRLLPSEPKTRPVEVRYRYGDPSEEAELRLLRELPGSRWDPGLHAAARELAEADSSPTARLTPRVQALALARAGFPGQARFARDVNDGAFPSGLVAEARNVAGDAVSLDVALSRRLLPGGETLWILGVAPHRGDFDPIPRDVRLDEPVALRADVPGADALVLCVAPPVGSVYSEKLSNHVAHWIDHLHVPGEHRIEVLDLSPGKGRVIHEFSLFVEQEPPPLPPLPGISPPMNPMHAAAWLYDALDARRDASGLRRLVRFPLFEPLAREHSAIMAATGILDHAIPGQTDGVAAQAWRRYHPGARHTEALAAAFTPEDLLDVIWLSPGHRRNLLCEDCTHVAVGVALEPVLDALPRLFATFEMLAFPQGEPRAIERPR